MQIWTKMCSDSVKRQVWNVPRAFQEIDSQASPGGCVAQLKSEISQGIFNKQPVQESSSLG
ncbi:unnamed protein product, partial [Amoebophrya sp. A25]|eukprot:GSA25T00024852001.1